MDKQSLINLLKITPLTDELNIIYDFYTDEYLYVIFSTDNIQKTIGIYDNPQLLLKCPFYIKKNKSNINFFLS